MTAAIEPDDNSPARAPVTYFESALSDEGPRGVSALRQKMELYRRNGAQLGWLLLPAEQAVEIWCSGDAPAQRIAPATTLDGGDVVPGLQIELAEIWQG